MADVGIQSCLFDQNFTHIFGYKKNNRPKKNPSSIRRTVIYKTSETNFKLIGQAVLKLQCDHRLRKHGFEKNAFKVLSTDRDGSIQSHLSPSIIILFVWNFQRILLKYSTFRTGKKKDFFQNSN